MNVMKNIINRVTFQKKNILLHEYEDPRIVKAICNILQHDVANITVLGNHNQIFNKINDVDNGIVNYIMSNISIIDPKSPHIRYIVNDYNSLYNNESYTFPEYNNIDIGHILLKSGLVDGMVSGSTMPTGQVIRSALTHLGVEKNISTLSSFFLMENSKRKPLLFADCAVIISPNAKQLAEISMSTRNSYKLIFGNEPKIALLSHSTKGSSRGKEIDKILEALSIIKKNNNDIIIDGELQLDAALVPEIAYNKNQNSCIKGDADILIFPSLDAGNIGYKLAERLGDYSATGPVFQGLERPSNDLSRGCSTEDIYNMIAMTCLLN